MVLILVQGVMAVEQAVEEEVEVGELINFHFKLLISNFCDNQRVFILN